VDPVVTNITNGVVTNITPANVVADLSCSQPGNVLREFVGVRIVGCDELHAGIHQGGDEGQIAGQAVEFGDAEFGLMAPAGRQGLLEFGASAGL
jgi:hypothetical protein